MTTILISVLFVCLLALAFRPRPQPPAIIYVYREPTPPRRGLGCLPTMIILGVVLVVILALIAR